jgi:pSer/pThr/pTyr-binding forkhead associated (FHA) protein
MECTLKIIAGPESSQEFVCSGPETYLGRSQRCLVRLSSPSISFEHALITRIGDDFFVENLSANGTLLNNERLLAKTRLRAKDQIQLGTDTVLRVERLPAASAAAGNRRWLLVAFVAMLVAGLLVVILDPFGESSSTRNLHHVYRIFQNYTQEQVARGGMPRDIPTLLADAWRLQTAGDRTQAQKAWLKLHVTLDAWDLQQGRIETSRSTRGLQKLIDGTATTLPDDDMRIAFKQFVIRMERPQ